MELSIQRELETLLPEMNPDQARRILQFARFLKWEQERADWQEFGKSQLARAYSDSEPEYSAADIKNGPNS